MTLDEEACASAAEAREIAIEIRDLEDQIRDLWPTRYLLLHREAIRAYCRQANRLQRELYRAVLLRRQHARWEDDPEAQELVREHGDMLLEEVGDYLGVSRERVRQIQEVALRTLKRRLQNGSLQHASQARPETPMAPGAVFGGLRVLSLPRRKRAGEPASVLCECRFCGAKKSRRVDNVKVNERGCRACSRATVAGPRAVSR